MKPVSALAQISFRRLSAPLQVIMVGGSSKLTLMQEKLKARFGDKVKLLNDPDVAVALGAAKLAWLDEQSEGKGEETEGARVITMQDSVPIGLGIEAVNGNHQK